MLRQWKESDFLPFSQLNADADVMRYFPACISAEKSRKFFLAAQKTIKENGWGLWAVERKADNQFVGFVGLNEPSAALPCSPCVEVGWRLAKAYWGYGYATEAAKSALNYAFAELSLNEVVSFTSTTNKPSIAVMARLGMVNTEKNFHHPAIQPDNPLSEHVLYKITQRQWQET